MDKILEVFMSDFASNMSVVVSLVSVLTAFISATVTASRTSKEAIRLKQMELSYEKQLQAYSSFLAGCANFSALSGVEEITALDNAYSVALLFASERTQKLMKAYLKAVHQTVASNAAKSGNTNDFVRRASALRLSLAQSMHDDLQGD